MKTYVFVLSNVLKYYAFKKSVVINGVETEKPIYQQGVLLVWALLCASWDVISHSNDRALAEPLLHRRAEPRGWISAHTAA